MPDPLFMTTNTLDTIAGCSERSLQDRFPELFTEKENTQSIWPGKPSVVHRNGSSILWKPPNDSKYNTNSIISSDSCSKL